MNEQPLISICIPAFNAQESIYECLESISKQTFKNYEVIVVDDGSTPSLQVGCDLLSGLNVSCLKLIRQNNSGTYAARQKAIDMARGRYVFCVDADDSLFGADALEKISGALERDSFPDVLLFNACRENGVHCLDYDGMQVDGAVERNEVIRRFFLNPGWNSMWSLVFRRSLFCTASSRFRLLMAEDRLQKAEVFARASTFALLDKPLYLYKEISGSRMNSPFEASNFFDRVYVGCRIRELLDELGATEKMWAVSFNGYIVTSLFELAVDSHRNRRERIRLYMEFREAEGCDEALAWVREGLAIRDAVCLCAFAARRWVLLDALLCGRCLISKTKRALAG